MSTLLQYYLLVPLVHKDVHLIYLANHLASNSIMIFTRTVHDAQRWVVHCNHPAILDLFFSLLYSRLSIMLRSLGFPAVPLHGQLSQSQRLGALGKFKSGDRKLLVATDVASRFVPDFWFYLRTSIDVTLLIVVLICLPLTLSSTLIFQPIPRTIFTVLDALREQVDLENRLQW